jgi:Txe/YoeB family toxin of Txe-Axe toxin-antitoxin module
VIQARSVKVVLHVVPPLEGWRLTFENQGREDYTSWLKTDRKMLARINKLIEDVQRDPFSGIGKPEPLNAYGIYQLR